MKNNFAVIIILFLGFFFCDCFTYADEKIDFFCQEQFKIDMDEMKEDFKEIAKAYGESFRLFPTKDDLTLHMNALGNSLSTHIKIIIGLAAAVLAMFLYLLKRVDGIGKDIVNIFSNRLSKLETRLDEMKNL